MAKGLDLIGETFGKLRVVCESFDRDEFRYKLWTCVCECGRTILVNTKNLRNGHIKSCGCLQVGRKPLNKEKCDEQ